MVRHQSNKAAAAELVNFHFSSSPPSQSQMVSPPRRNQQQQGSRNRQQHRRSEKDRASARRKAASSMFYLHSSADHAFVLTRRAKQQGYTFSGPDEAVSWDAVRTVKAFASDARQETCPICLDRFICPRITKCGHCFCLSCLLRHVHTQSEANQSQAVKCPCCGLPVHLDDCRPVVFESVQPPRLQRPMSLVKLHRAKECPAPYLPRRNAYRHCSPHSAPTATEGDAPFCRFNYVDPDLYQSQLASNQVELESHLSELEQQASQHPSVAMETIFVHMALEDVRLEQQRAAAETREEKELAERYHQPQTGMYQPFPDSVFASEALFHRQPNQQVSMDAADNVGHAGRPNRAESIDSTDSMKRGGVHRERRLQNPKATMYLNDDATHFYQSADGQLCFLCSFNMSCLLAEFSACAPENDIAADLSPAQLRKLRPLPDVIEGNVLEIETLHLTADLRKRLPFLSHLPLYIDIHFVELDLNRFLSEDTRQRFKAQMEKRRKKRKSKATAEKRIDRIAREKEEARINELKARIQRIDPNDDFFQVPEEPPTVALTGEKFGPSISTRSADDSADVPDRVGSTSVLEPQTPPLSFSAVCATNAHPTLMTEEAFPSLSSSPVTGTESNKKKPTWNSASGWHGRPRNKSFEEGHDVMLSTSPPHSAAGKGKKSKKKVLLFSTGGHRGSS